MADQKKRAPKLRRLELTSNEIDTARWIIWEALLIEDFRSRLNCEEQTQAVRALATMNDVLDGRR
jgi:hypothetical protein